MSRIAQMIKKKPMTAFISMQKSMENAYAASNKNQSKTKNTKNKRNWKSSEQVKKGEATTLQNNPSTIAKGREHRSSDRMRR